MLNTNFAAEKLPKNSKTAPFFGFAGIKGDSWYKEMPKSPLYTDLHGTIMCTSILYQHVPDKFTGTPLLVQKFDCWYSMLVQGKLDYNILILLIIKYIFAGTGKLLVQYAGTLQLAVSIVLYAIISENVPALQ
jgi:hypothetical protein